MADVRMHPAVDGEVRIGLVLAVDATLDPVVAEGVARQVVADDPRFLDLVDVELLSCTPDDEPTTIAHRLRAQVARIVDRAAADGVDELGVVAVGPPRILESVTDVLNEMRVQRVDGGLPRSPARLSSCLRMACAAALLRAGAPKSDAVTLPAHLDSPLPAVREPASRTEPHRIIDLTPAPTPAELGLGVTQALRPPGPRPARRAGPGSRRLLYVVRLGDAADPGVRREQRQVTGAVLDEVARRSSDFLVRVVGCGDGADLYSDLDPARAYRPSATPGRTEAWWPRPGGRLALPDVCDDLSALLGRDQAELSFEAAEPADVTWLMLVSEPLPNDDDSVRRWADLTEGIRCLWLVPRRGQSHIGPRYRDPDRAAVLEFHREVAAEVARELGLPRQRGYRA